MAEFTITIPDRAQSRVASAFGVPTANLPGAIGRLVKEFVLNKEFQTFVETEKSLRDAQFKTDQEAKIQQLRADFGL